MSIFNRKEKYRIKMLEGELEFTNKLLNDERELSHRYFKDVADLRKQLNYKYTGYPYSIKYLHSDNSYPWSLVFCIPCETTRGVSFSLGVVKSLLSKFQLKPSGWAIYGDSFEIYLDEMPTHKDIKETIEQAKEITQKVLDQYESAQIINNVHLNNK